MWNSPTGARLTNWALRAIIQFAHGVDQPSRLANVPDWVSTTRYDIDGRGALASADDLRAMLQSLLADRFQLSTHTERRPLPVYRLRLARGDGRLGPALHPSTVECLRAGARPGPAATTTPQRCGPQPAGPGKLVFVGSPLGQLAGILALSLGRNVVDATGLNGRFNLELSYTPEAQRDTANNEGPSIFTALEEQLGLKLDPGTEERDVLIIDRVERPADN